MTCKPAQVETEVLAKYEQQLLEKENSGCAALLRDDKVRRRTPFRSQQQLLPNLQLVIDRPPDLSIRGTRNIRSTKSAATTGASCD